MTAKTAEASSVPEPLGKPGGPGLFGIKGAQLPPYIQHVRNELIKKGKDESKATQMAIGIVRNWAVSPKTSPDVKAAAVKAIAEYDRLRAQAKATPNSHAHANEGPTMDFANSTSQTAQAHALKVQAAQLKAQAASTSDKAAAARLTLRARQLTAQAGVLTAKASQSNSATSAAKKVTSAATSASNKQAAGTKKAAAASARAKLKAQKATISSQKKTVAAAKKAASAKKTAASKAATAAKKGAKTAATAKLTATQNAEQARLATQKKGIDSYNQKADAQANGQPVLPPGATHWKHGWIPVNSSGQAVGPSQAPKGQQGAAPAKKKPAVAAGKPGGKAGGVTMSGEHGPELIEFTAEYPVVSSADGARATIKLGKEIKAAQARHTLKKTKQKKRGAIRDAFRQTVGRYRKAKTVGGK